MLVASFVSHLVRKIVKNVGLDLARAPRAEDFLQHSRVRLRLVPNPAALQLRRVCRDLFKKLASCRRLGLCTPSSLALPDASWQPPHFFATTDRRTVHTEVGRRATAPRVLDFAVLGVLIVTRATWNAAWRKMAQTERACES